MAAVRHLDGAEPVNARRRVSSPRRRAVLATALALVTLAAASCRDSSAHREALQYIVTVGSGDTTSTLRVRAGDVILVDLDECGASCGDLAWSIATMSRPDVLTADATSRDVRDAHPIGDSTAGSVARQFRLQSIRGGTTVVTFQLQRPAASTPERTYELTVAVS